MTLPAKPRGRSPSAVATQERMVLWLGRCSIRVEAGALRVKTSGFGDLEAGDHVLPVQGLRAVLLGPGSSMSEEALAHFAEESVRVLCVGENGVRYYAVLPYGGYDSRLAHRQVSAWVDATGKRRDIARRMYAWRMGIVPPTMDIEVLRGLEGARAKKMYRHLARQHGILWHGRRYDRTNPEAADLPNQAINHAAAAVEAAATIAVLACGAVPQLGFIHEDSGGSFSLDLADLVRDEVTVPCAFSGVRMFGTRRGQTLESVVRQTTGRQIRKRDIVSRLMFKIEDLFS